MNETVYRQAVIDGVLELHTEHRVSWQDAVIDMVDALPSADPDIIRCGECKYLMADGRCYEFADDNIRPSASDFCSVGVRK